MSAVHDSKAPPKSASSILTDLIDMIDDAVIVTGPELDAPGPVIEFVNAAFERMSGYSAAEVIGRSPRLLQGPRTDRAELDRMRRDLMAEGRFVGETVNYRKDGTPFVIEWRIKALRDGNGAITGWLSVQRDITGARRAVEAQRRLAREVDHRAKNALALVQGIVRLSRAEDVAAYAHAVQGRVDALADAHALLSEAGWRGVSLKRLVGAGVGQSARDRDVQVSGPEITLPAALVQPLALLLHEMLNNAVQHGALGTRRGQLLIDWSTADGTLRLDWREVGGPPPPPARSKGFGLSIIEAIAARQLGGRVRFDWESNGLAAELRVPLRRAARD